jgi:hypothetical protein
MISLVDIGWAAGFYEGEGSFVDGRYVSVAQKTEEPLIKFQSLFGGSINKWNGVYYLRLSADETRQCLLTIFSLLSRRRKDKILENKEFFLKQDTCPNGHTYPSGSKEYSNYRTGGTYRSCKICAREKQRRKNAKRRAA